MSYLLTLDLATHTGWTKGRPDDRHFDYGTHVLPKTGDIGAFLQAYTEWLTIALDGVDLCVFEAPILPRQTSLQTLRKLYGLAGVTEQVCHMRGIKCREVNLMSVKAFVCPRMRSKDEMVRAIRLYGYDPKTTDEADAIGIRLFVLHAHFPKIPGLNLELGILGARP